MRANVAESRGACDADLLAEYTARRSGPAFNELVARHGAMVFRTCGRILARNRKLYGLRGHEATPRKSNPMPFKAHWRHEYWTVDVRYIDVHQLGNGNVYTITILDNYSRFIVDSVLSRVQNLRAYLHVLLTALKEYGAPQALVSDGGSIFKAKGAEAIYQALSIRRERIQLRQPWQSYIETCFNVQRRMADYHFAKATTWECSWRSDI